MWGRRTDRRQITAYVVLVAIAAAGFAPAAQPAGACAAQNRVASSSPCSTARSCCCDTTALPATCSCQTQEAPPRPSPVLPDDDARTLRYLPWPDANPVLSAVEPSDQPHPVTGRRFFSPPPRSVQSLLCIWRI